MTLGFSTQINGKHNYFPQKIIMGLPIDKWSKAAPLSYFGDSRYAPYFKLSDYEKLNPKFHTIREDASNRWKAGADIHMVINNRTNNRFQFAPVVKCVSVQNIKIYPFRNGLGRVVIADGDNIVADYSPFKNKGLEELVQLALNDGFDSVEDFFAYFNKDFKGKIIHWTDLNY